MFNQYYTRWSLHASDYLLIHLPSAKSTVNTLRNDLYSVDVRHLPRYLLDEMEVKLEAVWKFFYWSLDEELPRFQNGFEKGIIDVFSEGMLIPQGMCKITISVAGIHRDSRKGNTYVPILLFNQVDEIPVLPIENHEIDAALAAINDDDAAFDQPLIANDSVVRTSAFLPGRAPRIRVSGKPCSYNMMITTTK